MLKLTRVSISDKQSHAPPNPRLRTNLPRPQNELGLVGNDHDGDAKKTMKACMSCKGTDHWISACAQIKGMNPRVIMRKIQEAGGCTICIRRGHLDKDCLSNDKQNCFYCKERKIPGANTYRKILCLKKSSEPTSETAAVGHDEPILPHVLG